MRVFRTFRAPRLVPPRASFLLLVSLLIIWPAPAHADFLGIKKACRILVRSLIPQWGVVYDATVFERKLEKTSLPDQHKGPIAAAIGDGTAPTDSVRAIVKYMKDLPAETSLEERAKIWQIFSRGLDDKVFPIRKEHFHSYLHSCYGDTIAFAGNLLTNTRPFVVPVLFIAADGTTITKMIPLAEYNRDRPLDPEKYIK